MDYGMLDTSLIGVITYNWKIPNRKTDVPTPDQRSLSKPDTGIGATHVILGLKFNEQISDNTKIGLLTKFNLEAQTVKLTYPRGRFGLRNNKKPWMNFQPTANAGYKIADGDFNDIIQFGGMFDSIIILEFAGDTTELVAQINARL